MGPVENNHVVVQLGIAVSRIEVSEACSYDANYVLFDAPLFARSCVEDLALGVGEDLRDRFLVAPVDHFAGLSVGQSPSGRDTLGGAERQVEPTHGLRARNPSEHLAGDRIGAVLQHPLEVFCTNGLPDGNTKTVVETDESGSEKYTRGSARFAVVANQVRLVGAFGTIAYGD